MIDVIHEDEDLIAVSKPAGMTVHRDARSVRGETFVLQTASAATGRFLYPVHRLDRNSSGVLVFAASSTAARDLQEILARTETIKTYVTLVRGETPEAFASDRPLTNERGERRPSRTEFQRLATFSRCSLLGVRLFTGRHHQIRRHLNHLAHHVIGDTTHGKGRINAWFREHYGLPRMFLHASRLTLAHPRSGERLELGAPLAHDLRVFLGRLPDVPEGLVTELDRPRPS